jgi:hypothetical protein
MMGPVCACMRRKSTCDSKAERDVTGIEIGEAGAEAEAEGRGRWRYLISPLYTSPGLDQQVGGRELDLPLPSQYPRIYCDSGSSPSVRLPRPCLWLLPFLQPP